jgi:hypothetical protein
MGVEFFWKYYIIINNIWRINMERLPDEYLKYKFFENIMDKPYFINEEVGWVFEKKILKIDNEYIYLS